MGDRVYEEFTSISGYICYRLFSIGEDGFRTRRVVGVWKLSGWYKDVEDMFPQLRDHSCTPNGESKGG